MHWLRTLCRWLVRFLPLLDELRTSLLCGLFSVIREWREGDHVKCSGGFRSGAFASEI